MITLQSSQLQELLIGSEKQNDPINLLTLLEDSGFRWNDEEFTNEAIIHIADFLIQKRSYYPENIRNILAMRPTQLLDRISAEIIAEKRCSPSAACALAIIMDENVSYVEKGTDILQVYIDQGSWPGSDACLTDIAMGAGIRWHAIGQISVNLPETFVVSCLGRPLREVISHNVLNRHNLTITDVIKRPFSHEGVMTFVVDSDRTSLSVDELMAIKIP